MRIPPPRSKSPMKTYLNSPARRLGSAVPTSPGRGATGVARSASTAAPVRRKLDFSNNSFDEGDSEEFPSPQKRGNSAMPAISTAKLSQVERLRPGPVNASNEQDDSIQEESAMLAEDDYYQLLDAGDNEEMPVMDEEDEAVDVSEVVEEPAPTKKGKGKMKAVEAKVGEVKQAPGKRGRPKKQVEEVEEESLAESPAVKEVSEPVKKKLGRPKKNAAPAISEEPEQAPPAEVRPASQSPEITKKKRGRAPKQHAVEEEAVEVEEVSRPAKRTRRSLDAAQNTKSKPPPKEITTTKDATKPKGRKPSAKLDAVAESDSPMVIRGPPIPRNNPGLFIFRRETPMEGVGFKQTRSGRNSIRPVDYWRGEKIEYNTDVTKNILGKNNFLMPTIKEVVRTEETDRRKQSRSKSKGLRAKKRADSESEDEAELEPWEVHPGIIRGQTRAYNPDDQLGADAEEIEAEIAFSAGAVVTSQIPNATFRFAKTLTLPFFGSGMVDVPPGGAKKLKNSRKMQMVFFVHRGRVRVTVNDTSFRIGTGGMWQVPRGNFYSIENDYDKDARIFFAQGNEVVVVEGEGEEE